MNLPHVPRINPPSLAIKVPLLLAEWCPLSAPDLPENRDVQPLGLRALPLTVILKQIISPAGWHHGGIND